MALTALQLDTIVVAAHEGMFKERFLGERSWYAIRIDAKRIPDVHYIAVYRVAPVAAVTHIAKVARIERWGVTEKFCVYFDAAPVPIGPVRNPPKSEGGVVIQSPRFTNREKLLKAKSLPDVFGKAGEVKPQMKGQTGPKREI